MFNILIFLLLYQNAHSSYYEIPTEYLSLKVHEDISAGDFNKENIDKIFLHIDSYLELEEKQNKREVYVSLYNITKAHSPLESAREKDPISKVVIGLHEFDVLDRDSFDFIFCYELSKQLIKDKVKESMQYSLQFIDYIYPLRDKFYSLFFQEWVVNGIALKIAKDFARRSGGNLLSSNRIALTAMRAIDYSYVKGNHVRYKITPEQVFTYLREDDFNLKYIFAHFLDYVSSVAGPGNVKAAIKEILSDVKGAKPFARSPLKVFTERFGKNLFWQWWSSFEKRPSEAYEFGKHYSKISNLTSNNGLYYLQSAQGKSRIVRNGRAISAKDIEHFDLQDGELYFTAREIDFKRDKFKYNFYRGSSLLKSGVAGRFFLSPKAPFWVENHGFRDRIIKDGVEVLPLSYGIKVEKLVTYKGRVIISGAQEDKDARIFDLTNGLELCSGSSVFISNDELFFITNEKDKICRLNLEEREAEVIYEGEVEEAIFHENSLIIKRRSVNGDRLYRVSPGSFGKKKLAFKAIERVEYMIPECVTAKMDYRKTYPDFDIFYPKLTFGLHALRGQLIKAKTFEFTLSWDIVESLMEGLFNPRIETKVAYPYHIGRNFYFVPGISISLAMRDGADDNNLKFNFDFDMAGRKLSIAPRIGIRGNDAAKLGLSTILDSSIYLHHHIGYVGEESSLPEFKWYKIVSLKKSGKDGREATSFLVLGFRKGFEINLNLTVDPYKLKIKGLELDIFAYYMRDFVRSEGVLILGTAFGLDLKLYGWDAVLKFLVVASEESPTFNVAPKIDFAFNYEINF